MSKKVNKSKIFTLHLTGIAFIYIKKQTKIKIAMVKY